MVGAGIIRSTAGIGVGVEAVNVAIDGEVKKQRQSAAVFFMACP
jgi:hypothetical protein